MAAVEIDPATSVEDRPRTIGQLYLVKSFVIEAARQLDSATFRGLRSIVQDPRRLFRNVEVPIVGDFDAIPTLATLYNVALARALSACLPQLLLVVTVCVLLFVDRLLVDDDRFLCEPWLLSLAAHAD